MTTSCSRTPNARARGSPDGSAACRARSTLGLAYVDRLLDQLGSRDVISKYKAATDDLVQRRTELETIKQRRERMRDLQKAKRELASKKAALTACDADTQDEIDRVSEPEGTGLFARLRSEFDGIVYRVISQHGMLSVNVNSEGHAEFKADISDKRGMSTNQDEGSPTKSCCVWRLTLHCS